MFVNWTEFSLCCGPHGSVLPCACSFHPANAVFYLCFTDLSYPYLLYVVSHYSFSFLFFTFASSPQLPVHAQYTLSHRDFLTAFVAVPHKDTITVCHIACSISKHSTALPLKSSFPFITEPLPGFTALAAETGRSS